MGGIGARCSFWMEPIDVSIVGSLEIFEGMLWWNYGGFDFCSCFKRFLLPNYIII